MQIRRAKVSDVKSIKSLADALVVKKGEVDKTSGFYDYSLTSAQYLNRVSSPFFFVAENNGGLEGFCMAYDSRFVRKLAEQDASLKKDVIFKYLLSLIGNYVYADQLAVRQLKSYTGGLAACKLIDRLKEASSEKGALIGVVPHSPWKNEPAIKFHTHEGARLVEEIGTKGKIVFGVYRISLS